MNHATTDPTYSDTAEYWHSRSQKVVLHRQALIDGAFSDAGDDATFTRINPATGVPLGEVAECGPSDVDRAVAAARREFEQGEWRELSATERKGIMLDWADRIRRHSEEIALLESMEAGKPIANTKDGDIPACANTIAWYAEAIDKLYDQVAPVGSNEQATITREPMGVVAAIVPWNYASIIASWKLGPALAAGNSVILKPAEQSPFAALRLGELALEAGIPAGALQVLTGRGHITGAALADHMDIDGLAFTGSTAVGKAIMRAAANSNMKRVALECGGKSPQVVSRECADLDKAANAIAGSIWYNAGQTCHAGSRLIVDRQIHDDLVERILALAGSFAPGDPLDPQTAVGSMIEPDALHATENYVRQAETGGARIRIGGQDTRADSGGWFYMPTLIDNVRNDMPIAREEIFGPVLSVIPCEDLDEGIRIANDTPYGLAASIWSDRISDAHRAAAKLRAGTVWINCYDLSSPVTPFGGYKQSGIGRDRSLEAFNKFTEVKTTWLSY